MRYTEVMVASVPPGPLDESRDRRSDTQLIGLALGPLVFGAVLVVPLELTPGAHRLAAVFAWAVVYWVTEAVPAPVTALLSSTLAIILGIAPASRVLAAYADPVIFLFIGSFVLAEAIRSTSLDQRLAFTLLAQAWATRTPGRLLATLGGITCVISLWVSNTATTAIMLPIGIGLMRATGMASDGRSGGPGTGILLMLTWASSVAVGVPVGSPPNLIAIGMVRDLTDQRLTFFQWMAVGMPVTLVMLALCWVILRLRYVGGVTGGSDVQIYARAERQKLGPWTPAQINVALVFTAAAVLWMLPGLVIVVSGPDAGVAAFLDAHLPESAVALGAAVLLFVLPTSVRRGEFTLSWPQAVRIDWGTILLFGGGLALGRLMFDTVLAEAAGRAVVRISGAESLWSLTAVAIVLGVVLSEASSNTAATGMVVPVVIGVAQAMGVSAIPPAIGAAVGASLGFMLPVSTPPNAIVYGSGLVPLREMIRSGIVLDVAGAVVIWVALRFLCPALGLA
jgi:sodium-dependent dicarboxylate transporter 2/3/5